MNPIRRWRRRRQADRDSEAFLRAVSQHELVLECNGHRLILASFGDLAVMALWSEGGRVDIIGGRYPMLGAPDLELYVRRRIDALVAPDH